MIYESVDQIDFAVSDCPTMPLQRRVAMATPVHYDVQYVINPHMAGHVGNVDRVRARRQWETLRDTYRELGMEVYTAEGVEKLYDMVFAANSAAAILSPDGKSPGVIMSRMATASRFGESIHYERFFRELGYEVLYIPEGLTFEGGADAIWHPGRRLIWGGYGQRTDRATHDVFQPCWMSLSFRYNSTTQLFTILTRACARWTNARRSSARTCFTPKIYP